MLPDGIIAAIITGILALLGGLGTGYFGYWREHNSTTLKNQRKITLYATPLLLAAWDLAAWFEEILDNNNYEEDRTDAYGAGWPSDFTSYLLGQYLSAVHIVRIQTQFFSFMTDPAVQRLKQQLWKVHDELITMEYVDRPSREMRFAQRRILAIQELMTVDADVDGDGVKSELHPMQFVEFHKNYTQGHNLRQHFEAVEKDFQRVVYRRYKDVYRSRPDRMPEYPVCDDFLTAKDFEDEAEEEKSKGHDPAEVPDQRIRRLQHLLVDLVQLLDGMAGMEFHRPSVKAGSAARCDCLWEECKPGRGQHFEERMLGTEVPMHFWKATRSKKKSKLGSSMTRANTGTDSGLGDRTLSK